MGEGGEQTLQPHNCTLESRCKHVTLWLHCYFYCSYNCKAKRNLFHGSLVIRIGLEYVDHHPSHFELLSAAISLDPYQTEKSGELHDFENQFSMLTVLSLRLSDEFHTP